MSEHHKSGSLKIKGQKSRPCDLNGHGQGHIELEGRGKTKIRLLLLFMELVSICG